MNDASDTVGVAQARKPSLAETPIPGNPDGKDVKLAVTARERRASTEPPTPDGEEPNEAELQTLRRVSGKIPWLAYSVAFVELCERFSVGTHDKMMLELAHGLISRSSAC